ncbi:MAG: SCO family protein [Candidatus Zixiibacteriota bacterium]
MTRLWTIWLTLVIVGAAGNVFPQVVLENAPDLEKIDVVDHTGGTVPLDLVFRNESGDIVRFAQFFAVDRPVILILGYYRCPMLCNLVFNGMTSGLNQLDWSIGKQFQLVNVTIDGSETPDLAAAKKANYLASLKGEVDPSGWAFLVGDSTQSRALADAVGFKYFYNPERQEWAHPAAAFVLTPEGRISRTLYGIEFSKTDLKLSLLEASQGRLGSPLDKLILYCYHYDPSSRGYTVAAGNLMKLGGAATVTALGIFVGLLWYGERLRRRMTRSVSPIELPKVDIKG